MLQYDHRRVNLAYYLGLISGIFIWHQKERKGMERKETKGRGKEATKQESKGKRRKGKDRDGKERKNERQGKGRKGQKRNGKERKWRESKGKEQKGKSRKGASERSLFVAGLAEWVGMHGLHKPFPLGGRPPKGSRAVRWTASNPQWKCFLATSCILASACDPGRTRS